MSWLLLLTAVLADQPEPVASDPPLRMEEQIVTAESAPLREGSVVIKTRPLSWEGSAIVYAGGRQINIRVRTRISREGNVISETTRRFEDGKEKDVYDELQ